MKNYYQFVNKIGLLLTVFVFASCASEQTVTSSKKRSGLDKFNNGYDIEKGDHGMMRSGSDKVSHYDRKASNIGSRGFSGKDYNKESYRSKRWGGNKGYNAKQYGGNTDGSKFQYAPDYVYRNVRAQGNGEYANANNSHYKKTGEFASASERASEGNANDVKTGSSGYVRSRNKRPEPLIMSKDDYNQLNIKDSRSLLGR